MKIVILLTITLFLFHYPCIIAQIDYAPLAGKDWKVSTPAEQGLDPNLVEELYKDASELEKLYAVLIIKNGYLVAEKYFNGGAVDKKTRTASVTKSFTSALTGIAVEHGLLSGLDQKMLEFFPEISSTITDPRKELITVRHLLQMRAGYPWEETDPVLWEGLLSGYYSPLIEKFPLINDPGTGFNYSNLSSNWLGIILSRVSRTNLKEFAQKNLFLPLGIEAGPWDTDAEGNNNGCGNLHLTARDMAKFGMLYLNKGRYEGKQVVPPSWVKESLQNYSTDAWTTKHKLNRAGRYFKNLGYGYQWWSAQTGDYHVNFAWGHGGQLIVLLNKLNLILVVKSDPFFLQHDDRAWKHEEANLNLAGRFILSLSNPDQMPPKISIHEAAIKGDVDAIKQYIQIGADLDEKDVYGSTPLIIASTFGNTPAALELINAGANLDLKNSEGSTAMITAAFFCRIEIVKALLAKGADKNLRNGSGASALDVVSAPYEKVEGIYKYIANTLAPLGLVLDYERIKRARPQIAEMLRQN